jgi:hypothetical protein
MGRSMALHGVGKIVISDDPVAADATCARLMGFEPTRICHIREASRFLGNSLTTSIDQAGEALIRPAIPFKVVPDWEFLHYSISHQVSEQGFCTAGSEQEREIQDREKICYLARGTQGSRTG